MIQFIPVTDRDGLRRIGIPLSTITAARLARKGRFAPLMKLSAHRSGWTPAAIAEWVEAQRARAVA